MTPWGNYVNQILFIYQMIFFSRIHNTETRQICFTRRWFCKSCRCTRCCFWFVYKFNIFLIRYFIISGTQYQHGNIGATIYIASGNTVDWTYGTANVTYSYAIELRDTGEYGFLLPEDQIIPSGQETLAGELALLKYIEAQVYA